MGLTILLCVFAGAVVVGLPVAFAMGIAAASAFWYEGFPSLITVQRTIGGRGTRWRQGHSDRQLVSRCRARVRRWPQTAPRPRAQHLRTHHKSDQSTGEH